MVRRGIRHGALQAGVPLGIVFWLFVAYLLGDPFLLSTRMGRLDDGLFALYGKLWLEGFTPYLDFWDHKPPGIWALNAFGSLLGGVRGIWLLGFGFKLSALACSYFALQRLLSPLVAGCAVAYMALTLPHLGGIATINGYILFFNALALLALAVLYVEGAAPRRLCLLLGLLFGAAFLLRQNGVVTPFAFFAFVLVESVRARRWREAATVSVLFAVGFLICAAPLGLYLWQVGALSAFWDTAFAYNFAYSRASLDARVKALVFGLVAQSNYNLAIVVLPLGYAIWRAAVKPARNRREIFLSFVVPIWFLFESLAACTSGYQYNHYFILPLLPLVTLLALALYDADAALRAHASLMLRRGALAVGLGVALSVAAYPFALLVQQSVVALRKGDWSSEVVRAAEAALADGLGDQSVFVWGNRPGIYLALHRPPPVRYAFMRPFMFGWYADKERVSELIHSFEAAKPAYIVDTSAYDDDLPSLASVGPGQPQGTVPLPREMHRFVDYVNHCYERRPGTQEGPLIVLLRRPEGCEPALPRLQVNAG